MRESGQLPRRARNRRQRSSEDQSPSDANQIEEVRAKPNGNSPGAADVKKTSPTELVSNLILDTVSDGIYCIDIEGRTTFINPAAARMTGFGPRELLGKSQHAMVHHSYADGSPYQRHTCPIYRALQTGEGQHKEDEVFWRKNGTCFPVAYTSTPIYVDGVLTGAVVSFQDISERVRRESWQQSKNQVFQSITVHQPLRKTLQLLADAYTTYDPGCSIALLLSDEKVPSNLLMVAGSALPEELESQLRFIRTNETITACGDTARASAEVFADGNNPDEVLPAYAELAAPGIQRCAALPMTSANGESLGVVAFFRLLTPTMHGVPPSAISQETEAGSYRAVRDLAQIAVENRKLHNELIHVAQHDHLTGLPNRILLESWLRRALLEADHTQTRVAVCFVDIDRFRRVNENFGHLVGDELLRQIAFRLTNGIREIDTVARESGDEFLVVLPGLNSTSDADLICRRLVLALAVPFAVQGHSLKISANIGVNLYPDHASTTESLIRNAATAVQFAKAKGQSKLQLFRPDMGEKVRQLAAREAALGSALERDELYLMYQPLYDRARNIHGFEALLRWNSPELGLIPPDQFIPLAESTGLILSIGAWVLHEACRQAVNWKAPAIANSKMFVNVSALQLGQVDFTQQVSDALRKSGLPPSRLELEVTESLIVPSFKKAAARLQPLRDLGVSIAIDDFGTGHSSLGVLHKLPINAIKVDRSFVARIDRDASGLSTVRAIVDLAKQLGMQTVGEGVETEAQFKLLREMECDYFQGYLLSRPLTPEAAQLLFEEKRRQASRSSGENLKISA